MTRGNRAVVVAAGVCAVWLAGCTSVRGFRADWAASGGRWDDAVALYESALRSGADDSELQQKLRDARVQASRMHQALAEAALAEEDFEGAVRAYEAALRHRDNPDTRAALGRARDRKRLADARSDLEEGRRLEQVGDLGGARDSYQKAGAQDPGLYPTVRVSLERIEPRIEEAKRIAGEAQAALRRERYDEAENLSRKALRVHPRDAVAREVSQQIRLERETVELTREVARAERAGEHREAVEAARQAMKLRPSPSRRALRERVERSAKLFYAAKARRRQQSLDYREAIQLYGRAREFGDDPAAYAGELTDCRYNLELQSAREAERSCRIEAARTHYRNAERIRNPHAVEIRIGDDRVRAPDYCRSRQERIRPRTPPSLPRPPARPAEFPKTGGPFGFDFEL